MSFLVLNYLFTIPITFIDSHLAQNRNSNDMIYLVFKWNIKINDNIFKTIVLRGVLGLGMLDARITMKT